MDKGSEFTGKVSAALREQCGVCRKVIATRNPQANSMVESIHQVIGDMMRTRNIRGSKDPDKDFGWIGVLAAVRHAVNSTVHTANCATPTQLVFTVTAMPCALR